MAAAPLDPIIELLTTYSELNSTAIDELPEVPSPLEFMRYVARNRPFVIRGGASGWKATTTWNVATLKESLAGQIVNVAVTPDGYVWTPDDVVVVVGVVPCGSRAAVGVGEEGYEEPTTDVHAIEMRTLPPGTKRESCCS